MCDAKARFPIRYSSRMPYAPNRDKFLNIFFEYITFTTFYTVFEILHYKLIVIAPCKSFTQEITKGFFIVTVPEIIKSLLKLRFKNTEV